MSGFETSVTPCYTDDDDCNVVLITMNANRANVMTREFAKKLHDALDVVEEKYKNHSVVLTGNEKAFSAGFDLNLMAATVGTPEMTKYIEEMEALLWRIYTMPRPIIAAVNGHAIAGGMALASACDARIASGVGKCGMNEVQNGFLLPLKVFSIVTNSMPQVSADRVILSGALIRISDMGPDGLCWCEKIVAPELLLKEAIKRASFSQKSLQPYGLAKQMLRHRVFKYVKEYPHKTADILAMMPSSL